MLTLLKFKEQDYYCIELFSIASAFAKSDSNRAWIFAKIKHAFKLNSDIPTRE